MRGNIWSIILCHFTHNIRENVHLGSVMGMYFDFIHGSVWGYERAYHDYLVD
jgi:hypothetical protein